MMGNKEEANVERKANARAVFEQYWMQARHIENERLWLTNIFAVVFAGLLGLISVYGLEWYIPAFGILISITGLLAIHDLRIWFIRMSRLAEKILVNELNMEKYNVRKYREAKGINKYVSLPLAFVLFYTCMLALWVILLLMAKFELKYWFWIVFIGVICFSLIIYRYVFLPDEKKAEKEIFGKKE